jgi:hypothetical protein
VAEIRKCGYYFYVGAKLQPIMSSPTIPEKTALGWVVDVPNEIARELGVSEGSIAIIHAKDGRLELEILPPPSDQLTESVRQTYEQFEEAFDELKRLGD